jgi:murein DD-endopeptidase MepM/ murein hydrolase activator NlpD
MNKKFTLLVILVVIVTAGIYLYHRFGRNTARVGLMQPWFDNPNLYGDANMKAGTRCGGAPFAFPTNGLTGFIWDDYFNNKRHQGLDIFGGTDVGVTPVYAAYAGYLTRKADWKSSVIIRVPGDPLEPSRQIWVYYTHMADPDGNSFISEQFPPGTFEVYVETGTLLGYQGNYSGEPGNPTGVHLHISIVKDDGYGNFLNELDINNTYDPSPYFGMALNANQNTDVIPVCQ